MPNFELDHEFFLPPGHNIIDGGVDRLPRTYTTPALPITRRHDRFVITTVHPAPPADEVIQPLANSVVRFIRYDHGLGFRGQEGFRQGCLMLLGVPLDFCNTEDLRAAVNTFGEFHHWVSDDPYLVSWSAPVYILGTAAAEILPNDEDPMPLNGNPHPLPGKLVHDNLQFALPPYPALGWNAVPLAPGDPGPAAADAATADAADGSWGLPPVDLNAGGWGQPPADGGGWEQAAAPAAPADAPAADPVKDQESMVIDQPSPSSSDSVHELVDLDPQQGQMAEEPAAEEPPMHLPDADNVDIAHVDLAALADAPDNAVVPEAGAAGPDAGLGNGAELEEEEPRLEEVHDTNPLAMVLYKPSPPAQSNLIVGASRVLYGPPLPPVMSWARTFDNLMGPAAAMHIPRQFQLPILEPIVIPKRSWDVAFDPDTPGPSLSGHASLSLSLQEVTPISPASSSEDLSFRSPAPSKKVFRKKATPVVDSSVRRCTRGSIKRDGYKPTLQELPTHIPKKRKPKAKPMPSMSQETEDVPPVTPIPVIQEVGQSLGIAPEKLTVDRLMEDPADSAPTSSDV
uniref:DUF7597 domain-containing protein n=1 Tax=Hordeum vulgare subsp. vulgare TaxID=112509 RepID=A0A8I6XE61_HORVV